MADDLMCELPEPSPDPIQDGWRRSDLGAEVANDYRERGVTYFYGGDASKGGSTADCSHFVNDVYRQSGLSVPYVTTQSIRTSDYYLNVLPEEALPGDTIVQGGHMGSFTGRYDEAGRPIGTQMGEHGAKDAPFGPHGWFNKQAKTEYYRAIRPLTRDEVLESMGLDLSPEEPNYTPINFGGVCQASEISPLEQVLSGTLSTSNPTSQLMCANSRQEASNGIGASTCQDEDDGDLLAASMFIDPSGQCAGDVARCTHEAALKALSEDAKDWTQDVDHEYGKPGKNKCNLAIFDWLADGGIDLPLIPHTNWLPDDDDKVGWGDTYWTPPNPRDWRNPQNRPGFQSTTLPVPGDIADDGFHMGVVTDGGLIISPARTQVHLVKPKEFPNPFGVTYYHYTGSNEPQSMPEGPKLASPSDIGLHLRVE